jgi:chromosome segregation ATPase
MAAWLPVLKAALPYVSNIVAAAVPVFTARRSQEPAAGDLVAQQIAELQEAVTGNAETVKGLAAQLEQALSAIANGEAEQAQQLANLRETLSRCESTASLAQAQVTRLESTLAALRERVEQFDQHTGGTRRREKMIAMIAVIALIVAFAALLR